MRWFLFRIINFLLLSNLPLLILVAEADIWRLAQETAAVHRFSTLFTAHDVKNHLSTEAGRGKAINWCRSNGVTKVYIESFRDGYQAERSALEQARNDFTQAGFLVSGCVTTTQIGKQSTGWNIIACYSDTQNQARIKEIFEFSATLFNEIMIDDFWFTDCACEACEKGRRSKIVAIGSKQFPVPGESWEAYRCELMTRLSQENVLGAVHAINPQVKIIIKYPQWYDRFHERGYEVIRETADFDRIWVGTETRDYHDKQWGGTPQYEGYFIMRWLAGIGGEKCGGGWYDWLGTTEKTYVEQARQTILAGAKESMLFCYGGLQDMTGPANVAALRGQIPELQRVAAQVQKRTPSGVAAYKPANSDPGKEPRVFDFVGMLGIPLLPTHEFPTNAAAAFFSTHSLKDKSFRTKVVRYIASGRPVLITDGLKRELGDLPELTSKNVSVLPVESDPKSLLDISDKELGSLRAPLLKALGLAFTAPKRVATYPFADRSWVIENFNDTPVTVELNGEKLNIQARSWIMRWSSGAQNNKAPLTLFAPGLDLSNISAHDASFSKSPDGILVTTGQKQTWPGVTLHAPSGQWDLKEFGKVAVALRNVDSNPVRILCRVDNAGADGTSHCVTDSLTLAPGQSGTLQVTLKRDSDDKLGGKLFGMRGYPHRADGPGTVDPEKITQILLFVTKPETSHSFELKAIRAEGGPVAVTAHVTDAEPFFPFIDSFGQYKHRDWPGKIHSTNELAAVRDAEAKNLFAYPGPSAWDKYGGWEKGPSLTATGFFRTEKVRDKWWLVDPEGRLFWSHGIDCVRSFDATPVEEREGWFDHFPGDHPDFRGFFSTGYALKGHYAGRSVKSFSFAGANLQRKYGPDWKEIYPTLIHQRLRSWGVNTIANWSDESTRLLRRTPYTDALASRGAKEIEGSEGYWGKFPDPFDPGFAAGLRRSMASKNGRSADDPWCIGYFSDNEMSWGDEFSLALAVLQSPPEQAAKRQFVAELKEKFGDIAKLNGAWATGYDSWDALLESRTAPDKKRAGVELGAFYTRIAEEYFSTVRNAIKQVAPHQLYLGCRFAWANDRAAAAAGKYCDVVSYNLYQRSVADFKCAAGDKPLLIGEFHFGALDRGMFHTGLVPVESQQARAESYAQYVLGAVRHPQFVGTHWFQWMDEPTTGRVYDEENYQIGFVDTVDTPYQEIVDACRNMSATLYPARFGQ